MTRAKAAGLLLVNRKPVRQAILEFVLHGARYAFPAVRGRQARGMPTAHAAPPLSGLIHAGLDPIPVIDGRREIVADLAAASPDLRAYVANRN